MTAPAPPPLLWVLGNNAKTGAIPTAYVGKDLEQAWESCRGCDLREDGTCYAWNGLPRMIFGSQHTKRFAAEPERFALKAVLVRAPKAHAIRLGALGDPGRASPAELRAAFRLARRRRLAVLGYTHHWREPSLAWLQRDLMASCDTPRDVDVAIALGWRPAVVLPRDHQGKTFVTPGGARGVVCPAQTQTSVTCDSCRMCDPQAPVWAADRVQAIGFLEHSKRALGAARREGGTLPLFRPALSGDRGKGSTPAWAKPAVPPEE